MKYLLRYLIWIFVFASFLIALCERITYFSQNLPITLYDIIQIIVIVVYIICLGVIKPET